MAANSSMVIPGARSFTLIGPAAGDAAWAWTGDGAQATMAGRASRRTTPRAITIRRVGCLLGMSRNAGGTPADGAVRSDRMRQVRHRGAGDQRALMRRMLDCLR